MKKKTPSIAGVKHDTMKPRYDLISPIATAFLAQVLTYGAEKYAANNWREGIDQSRLLSAAMRHITAFQSGILDDPETGLPHTAHAMCCLMFSLELMTSTKNIDSRFIYTDYQKNLLEKLLADRAFTMPLQP